MLKDKNKKKEVERRKHRSTYYTMGKGVKALQPSRPPQKKKKKEKNTTTKRKMEIYFN